MSGWFIGPLMPALGLVSTILFVKALQPKNAWQRDNHFPVVYVLGMAPLTGLVCSFLFFDRGSSYISAEAMLLTTAVAVIVTALLLWIAYLVSGYPVVRGFFLPIKSLRIRPALRMLSVGLSMSVVTAAAVAAVIWSVTWRPLLVPCQTARCRGWEILLGDPTQVQNVVMLVVTLTNLLACLCLLMIRLLLEQLVKLALDLRS